MKVYVVEVDIYSGSNVGGVYASVDAAMEAYPVKLKKGAVLGAMEDDQGWRSLGDGHWWNGLDSTRHVEITEYELLGEPAFSP